VLCELWGAELSIITNVNDVPTPQVPKYVCGSVQGFKQHTKTQSQKQETDNVITIINQMLSTLFTYHTYLPSYMWLVGLFILTAVHPI